MEMINKSRIKSR